MKHLQDSKLRCRVRKEMSGQKGPDGSLGTARSQPRRRGTWWSYDGNVGMVEGVDFAPDSEEGGAGEYYFVPDSDEEVDSGLQLQSVGHAMKVSRCTGDASKVTAMVDNRKRQVSSDVGGGVMKVARIDGAARVGRTKVGVAGREDVVVATEDDVDATGDDTVGIGSEYVINEDMETEEQWIKGSFTMDPMVLQASNILMLVRKNLMKGCFLMVPSFLMVMVPAC